MKTFFTLFAFIIIQHMSFAQCADGEVEVSIIISTDNWGYETYWQLQEEGTNCGSNNLFEAGNAFQVGCNGAGQQDATQGNGYSSNATITEGPWCLNAGEAYDIIYVDDYGDGGASFEVLVNGYSISSFGGVGLGGTFTFEAELPPLYDLSIFDINLNSYMSLGEYELEAHVFNGGTETVSDYELKYQINGGDIKTFAVSGTSLSNFNSEEVIHNESINFTSLGVYSIDVWTENINGGNVDENPDNDVFSQEIEIGAGIPNIIDSYIGSNYDFETIANSSDQINRPTDLDFHPVLNNYELWITNKGTEDSGGSTVTLYNAGQWDQESLFKQDGNAWHFMSLPTGIAFSQNGNWANSPGVYDANHNGGDAFTGPALWSSDMDIYAEPSGGNGSHLDMLHYSPFCQGVAAEVDNVFWVFDGYSNDIVRYDFAEDHGPGNDFHGDAIVHRFSDDEVAKDPNDQIVSHLVLDRELQWLYVVDHGNSRVIRIDITTGSDQGGTPNYPANEIVEEYLEITGYTQEEVITNLNKPAGIDVIEDRMIVSEYESGNILIYDISTMPAELLETLETGLNSVQGVKIGPDGRIWFVDYNTDGVYRVWDQAVGVSELIDSPDLMVYPNPNSGKFNLESIKNGSEELIIRDITGKIVFEKSIVEYNSLEIDLNISKGIYSLELRSSTNNVVQKTKLIIQ